MKNKTHTFLLFIIFFITFQNQFSFAAEGCAHTQNTLLKKKTVIHKIKHLKKKYKRKKLKRIFKKFKQKIKEINKSLIFIIVSIVGIIVGLGLLGTSAWLIAAVILAILIYIAFASIIFKKYLENGFKLEWYWWATLFFALGIGIFLSLYFLGSTALSYLIIQLLAYVAIMLVAAVLAIMLIIIFFKAVFSSFKSMWHF